MESREHDNREFMSRALLDHAKEICRYARTFCEPTTANLAIDETSRRKFSRTVERMINEMRGLMLMARYKGVDHLCNREQIEAYIDEARLAIAGSPVSVRQSGALLN